jgi:hypothetical protein
MLHGNSLVVDAEDIRKLLSETEKDREIRDLQRQVAGRKQRLSKHTGKAAIGTRDSKPPAMRGRRSGSRRRVPTAAAVNAS